ncbi:hypothetical protein EYF80_009503 [Liparis tanakae]|uniref:Uncharacterized protein n=1 Tax=Liparis tanakae TaxID=230148 RepID=A0A4Z2IRE3_9TELE|nr:hypothetical protein EYF80_009503 [Liparis tanakae]
MCVQELPGSQWITRRAGGPPGNQAACCTYKRCFFYPDQQRVAWRRDGVYHLPHASQRRCPRRAFKALSVRQIRYKPTEHSGRPTAPAEREQRTQREEKKVVEGGDEDEIDNEDADISRASVNSEGVEGRYDVYDKLNK